MENYHVVYQSNGWEIIGVDPPLIFDTKKSAIEKARKIAQA